MLSPEEYNEIQNELKNIPKSLPKKQQNKISKRLKKRLKEHEYTTTYNLFEPLPYIPYFLNRTTSTQTLNSLIRAAQTTTEIIIDTESINIYKKCNKPALIQLQLSFSYNSSLVILIELYHLPRENHPCFSLMKQLFEIIFTHGKCIYIWGSDEELFPFVESNLFTTEQINHMKYCNLQDDFKRFWIQHHPHQTQAELIDANADKCLCESCLGHQPSHLWALQDFIALELNGYLPKLLTNERFNIGLDPILNSHHPDDNQYCEELTMYAMNDVLSMQQIINQMKHQNFEFTFRSRLSSSIDTINFSFIRTNAEQEQVLEIQPIDSPLDIQSNPNYQVLNWELEPVSEDDNPVQLPQPLLSSKERRKIHNYSCTLKQRKRYYQYQLTFPNFDRRFKIHYIKKILREKNIRFTSVNRPTSTITGRKILIVGIKDRTKLEEYEDILENFFSTEHFDYLRRKHKRRNFRTRRRDRTML